MITLTPGSRLPLAWRIGWRDLARDWRRGVMVVVLIMVPLALLIGVLIAGTSLQANLRDQVRVNLGSAAGKLIPAQCTTQSLLTGYCDYGQTTQPVAPVAEADLLARVPAGQRHVVERSTYGTFTIDGLGFQGGLVATDAANPLLRERYDLRSGGWPTGAEVLVNEAVAVRYGVAPGDNVGLDGHEYRVAGIVRFFAWAGTDPSPTVIVGLDHPFAEQVQPSPGDPSGLAVYVEGGLPPVADYPAWNATGVAVADRAVQLAQGDPDATPFGTGGGAGALVMMAAGAVMIMSVLVAGSAMAMGAERAQRVLALLSATGARPSVLRTIFAAQGIVLGMVAAVLALPLALAGAGLFLAAAERWQWAQVLGFRAPWAAVAGLACVAVVAGAAASAVPGLRVGGTDPARALARRHRSARPWVALVGLGVVAVSAVAVVTVAIRTDQARAARTLTRDVATTNGVLIAVVSAVAIPGVLLTIPLALRAIAHLSSRTSLAWRMAGRDLGRSRHRSVPVTAAVVAGSLVAGFAVSVAGYVGSYETEGHQWKARLGEVVVTAGDSAGVNLDMPAVIEAVNEVIPVRESRTFGTPRTGYLPNGSYLNVNVDVPGGGSCDTQTEPGGCRERMWGYPGIVIGDADLVVILAGVPVTQAMRDHLAAGGVIAFTRDVLDANDLVAFRRSVNSPNGTGTETRPAPVPGLFVAPAGNHGTTVLLSPRTAQQIGLVTVEHPASPAMWARLSRTPTEKQQAQLNSVISRIEPDSHRTIEIGPPAFSPIPWVAAAISGAVLLLIVAVITSLASSDRRRDDGLLAVLGGGPRLRRRVAAAQAFWLAAIGGVLGVLLAAYLSAAFFRVYLGVTFGIPVQLAFLVIGVPLLAAGIAWLTTPGRAGLREAVGSGRPQTIGGDG